MVVGIFVLEGVLVLVVTGFVFPVGLVPLVVGILVLEGVVVLVVPVRVVILAVIVGGIFFGVLAVFFVAILVPIGLVLVFAGDEFVGAGGSLVVLLVVVRGIVVPVGILFVVLIVVAGRIIVGVAVLVGVVRTFGGRPRLVFGIERIGVPPVVGTTPTVGLGNEIWTTSRIGWFRQTGGQIGGNSPVAIRRTDGDYRPG